MIHRFLRIHVVKPNHKQFLRLIATLLGGESHYVYIMCMCIYIWQACYYWLYKIRSTPEPKRLPIGPIDTKIL